MYFRNNYFGWQPFLMRCHFTNIFVHLSVIAAVSYFNVHKLIGRDPANIYFFKVNSRITRKWCEICPKLTIKTLESRFCVFNVNLEHNSHFWIGKCWSGSSFLCKYYYPKSKDERIIFLAPFKIAAGFLNS